MTYFKSCENQFTEHTQCVCTFPKYSPDGCRHFSQNKERDSLRKDRIYYLCSGTVRRLVRTGVLQLQLIKKHNFSLCPAKNRVHTADTDALIKAVVLIELITHMRLANCWSLTVKRASHNSKGQ